MRGTQPTDQDERAAIAAAWHAVSGSDAAAQHVRIHGPRGSLPSNLPVESVAAASVATALLAAVDLVATSNGPRLDIAVDRPAVAAAFQSERAFRAGARRSVSFAPLSRFWRTSDGWIRTHANYPWHRAALLGALDPACDDEDDVRAAIAEREADELAESVVAGGGVAAAVRSRIDWSRHPQGRAVSSEPLIGCTRIGNASPRRPETSEGRDVFGRLRVLDLTRVIAGPVATRYLGALGADVLRIDPPHLPDGEAGLTSDTLLGKRSALLDLREQAHLESIHELLEAADIVFVGYRPGALERFGLGPADLAERHPGVVAVYLSAWGPKGPWSHRRGFDSIVQAACGIAMEEAAPGGGPGALPCQALDHGTGYLAAAAALDGRRRQAQAGGTIVRSLSLARTAEWLVEGTARSQRRQDAHALDVADLTDAFVSDDERIVAVRPPGRLAGEDLRWPGPPARYGRDRPEWRPGSGPLR